jgi:hypothetical protein
MFRTSTYKLTLLSSLLGGVLATQAAAGILVNSGFESGFAGWTRANQVGSDGSFLLQTGTTSPVNGTAVPAPPGPTTAAMTDAQGPGSHVLYQNFTVASPVTAAGLAFDLFVGNRDSDFFTPSSLDFSTPALNQQARVDILLASADPFSVAPGDVLLNVFQTHSGDPLVSGYNHITADLTALVNAHLGASLRLRFAEVDNVDFLQMGVDNADITVTATGTVPEPAYGGVVAAAVLIGIFGRRGLAARTQL